MTHKERPEAAAPLHEAVAHPGPTSRRTLLSAGVYALAVAPLHLSMLRIGSAAEAVGAAASVRKFMTASRLLIQHRLSRGVGARMAAILNTRIVTLDADLDAIIRAAKEKNAKAVEECPIKQTAYQLIFAWYAGVVDDSPTAEVLAYEKALMYQPTSDAIPIPTYSFNGPDNWTDIDPPLSAMPKF